MSERIIIAPNTKEDIKEYINNVNYELKGKQIKLTEKEFESFLQSNIINEFFRTTGELIDDFETTIIDNDDNIIVLKKVIEESSFGFFSKGLKKKLIELTNYANDRKSGVVFFF